MLLWIAGNGWGVNGNVTPTGQPLTTIAEYAEQYYCQTHGSRSSECRALHRINGALATMSLGSTIGAAAKGKQGAAWGSLIGLAVGLAYPDVADWLRMNGVIRETRQLAAFA